MMLYTIGETPYRVVQIKTLSLFQGNPQNNDQTDTTAIMLYSLKKETGHERPKDKSTNKNKQEKQTKR